MLNRLYLAFAILFLNKKGFDTMVDVYVTLIIYGRKTINEVPLKQRQAVIDTLAAMGLNPDGTPIEKPQV